jgi:predicted amidophosphoribosyltransferase
MDSGRGSGADIFLSCFKCGRIVRSSDPECPRCGMQFGPGTLFECPFCSGLVWRNASVCASCGTDLTKFSVEVERVASKFDMDQFVDQMINLEVEEMKSVVRRVACPGCGLMIRGDETTCPRCDLPLADAKLDCPLCGEKIGISARSCEHCGAVFDEIAHEEAPAPAAAERAPAVDVSKKAVREEPKARPRGRPKKQKKAAAAPKKAKKPAKPRKKKRR